MYRIRLYIVPEDSNSCQDMKIVKDSPQNMDIHKVLKAFQPDKNEISCYIYVLNNCNYFKHILSFYGFDNTYSLLQTFDL